MLNYRVTNKYVHNPNIDAPDSTTFLITLKLFNLITIYSWKRVMLQKEVDNIKGKFNYLVTITVRIFGVRIYKGVETRDILLSDTSQRKTLGFNK